MNPVPAEKSGLNDHSFRSSDLSLERTIIRGVHVDRLYVLAVHEHAVRLALSLGLLPLGVAAERRPRLLRGLSAGERQQIDQRIVLAIFLLLGNPEADDGHSMLTEQRIRVVAEPRVESLELALIGYIGPQLEHAVF